jgi:hypothetical protein
MRSAVTVENRDAGCISPYFCKSCKGGLTTVTSQTGKVKNPTLTSQNNGEDGIGVFPRRQDGAPGYLQSTLLSCAAAICHLPLRFNQVSVKTWHCFASGFVLSLPMACSLP